MINVYITTVYILYCLGVTTVVLHPLSVVSTVSMLCSPHVEQETVL